MFKRAVVFLIAAILFLLAPPASAETVSADTAQVPIVMYHSISNAKSNDYVITPQTLESDFKYLKDRGYTAVFVNDCIDFVRGKRDLPKKPIVITFDDGFYNNYKFALPLLRKYGFKATISVVGSYMAMEKGMEKRSPVYSYLNASELRALKSSGVVELGNHTWDMHRIKGRKGIKRVSGETEETYRRKLIADAKKCHDFVADICGVDMNVYTYPYGYYSAQAREILKSQGYEAMLTCNEGMNYLKRGGEKDLLGLKRYNRPSKYSTKAFFDKMNVH